MVIGGIITVLVECLVQNPGVAVELRRERWQGETTLRRKGKETYGQ